MNYMFISSLKHSLYETFMSTPSFLAMTHEWDFPHNRINVAEHNWSTVSRPPRYRTFPAAQKGERRSINLPLTSEDIFTSIMSLLNIWKCVYLAVYPWTVKPTWTSCTFFTFPLEHYLIKESYYTVVLNRRLTCFSYHLPQAFWFCNVIDRQKEVEQSHDPYTSNTRASNTVGQGLKILSMTFT